MSKQKYTCENCGCKFSSKYKDSNLCITCLKDEMHDMEEKLSTHNKNEKIKTQKFYSEYKKKKFVKKK